MLQTHMVEVLGIDLFYLAVSIARDRKAVQEQDWRKEKEAQLRELVEERMEIRRAILRPGMERKIIK